MKHPFFIDAVLRSGSQPVTRRTASDADSVCRSDPTPPLKEARRLLTEGSQRTLLTRPHSVNGRRPSPGYPQHV